MDAATRHPNAGAYVDPAPKVGRRGRVILVVLVAVLAGGLWSSGAAAQTAAAAPAAADLCATVAYDAGLRDEALVTAVAVALSESQCNPSARTFNDPTTSCPNGSYDRGLWQINGCAHPTVGDACAFDAGCNARATFRISSGGTSWRPWSVFTDGAYLTRMTEARTAVTRVATTRPPGGPGVVSRSTGQLDMFKRGADNALWHRSWNGSWGPWVSLGGVLTSEPAAASWSSDRLDVFVRGTDNALWHKWWNGSWSGWASLGGVLTSEPTVASWGTGRLDVFARGTDNALWHKWWAGSWSGWAHVGGTLTSAASAVSWGPNRIDVFVRGPDNALWQRSWAGSWSAWVHRGGVLTSAPSAASWGVNRLDVFARGTDSALWHQSWAGSWSGWGHLGGSLTSGPSAVSWGPNRIDVLATGLDRGTWQLWWDGAWRPWQGVPTSETCSTPKPDGLTTVKVERRYAGTGPAVKMLGDSLTYGAALYGDIATAFSGYDLEVNGQSSRATPGGAWLVDQGALHLDASTAAVVVALGTNDRYTTCYGQLAEHVTRSILTAAPNARVMWLGPGQWSTAMTSVRSDLARWHDGGRRVFVDWDPYVKAKPGWVSSDGVHLTTEGYRQRNLVVVRELAAMLAQP